MNLTATTHSLELVTSTAVAVAWTASWVDIDKSGASTVTTPGSAAGTVSSATDTTIVAAPGSSVTRVVTGLSIVVTGAGAQTVTVQKDVSGTEYPIKPAVALTQNESLGYEDGAGWAVWSAGGALKTATPDRNTSTTGLAVSFLKVGTASKAAGIWYSHGKDSGTPGAWAVGSPGVGGRATDGTTTTDAGCLPIKTPASGSNYLVGYSATSTVAHAHTLVDILWVNSGLTLTTTTAQTVTSAAFPARDLDGATAGRGVWIGILVTATTANAGNITNTTIEYTSSAGDTTRTATMASFPLTASIGTVVWFRLQAGDAGVQSIQAVTLGTSYVSGGIALIAAVPLALCPTPLANVGGSAPIGTPNRTADTGVKLYAGTCAIPMYISSTTTATTTYGVAVIEAR